MSLFRSSGLQFSRDGRTLVIVDQDGIAFVGVHDPSRHYSALADVQSIAVFSDQIWVATRTGTLHRLTVDGRQIDEIALPPDTEAVLVPTTIGPPSALYAARRPLLLSDDLGRIAATAVDENTIPTTGRRYVRYDGARLTLPAGTTVTMPGGAQIDAGCTILDGTALALVAQHRFGRKIIVVALAGGGLVGAVSIPPGTIRIAARRGLAVIQDAARKLTVVDLRSGRQTGVVVADEDLIDFAVDPDGGRVALRGARKDSLELAQVGDSRGIVTRLFLHAPTTAAAELSDALAAAEHPTDVADVPLIRDEPAAGRASPIEPPMDAPPSLRVDEALTSVLVEALEPRPIREEMTRAQEQGELAREVRTVMLWAQVAIAHAWDTGRLVYGNESALAYEREVAGLVGSVTGFAPSHIAAAELELARHVAMLEMEPTHRSASSPLIQLSEEFGLSPAGIDVLIAIAAPTQNGHVSRLYGILANDPAGEIVDELILETVLARTRTSHEVAAELRPAAPLVRLGIVTIATTRPRPFAALEVDPVILSRLRGEAPDLGMAIDAGTAARDLSELDLAPGVLMSAAAGLTSAARPARIAVRGRAGSGRRTLLASLASKAGRAIGVIDAAQLPRDTERFVAGLQTALRRAQLAGLLPVIHRLEEVVLGERTGIDLSRDVINTHPGPLAVVTPPAATPPLLLGHAVIDLPALSETERLAIWRRELELAGRWLRDTAGLAARYRVGAGTIRRAVAVASGDDDATKPSDDRIDTYLRQLRNDRLAGVATRVTRLASWNNLVLPADIMDSLREFVGRVRHRRTVLETWGMEQTMSTSRGLTALFQGQPGTGKTLVAGIIARELGLDVYRVDLSKVMSKWIGETERNLATLFDAAEDGQVILLFDEADSLFAKRTEVRSSNDRYANLEVNYLLQRLDVFEGIAILTTNSGGSIDPAFKRRLSFQLSFPFPDEETRAALWRAHLPPSLPRAEELTFESLARKYQISGGYIRNACLRAAFLAAQEETTLHQHHLERAVALEFSEMGKLSTTGTIA